MMSKRGKNLKEISTAKVVLYRNKFEVRLKKETVWLSLNQMAGLFERDKSVISRHLHNIFKTKEIGRKSVVANFATTAADGKSYQVDYFNLDVIISIGYRVKSHRGTQFRIWATQRLREFIINSSREGAKRCCQGIILRPFNTCAIKRGKSGNYFCNGGASFLKRQMI